MSGAEEVGDLAAVFTALNKTTYRGEIFVLGIRVELCGFSFGYIVHDVCCGSG